MIDPVLVSALIDTGIKIIRKIVAYIDGAIRYQNELAALKDTIIKIEPYLKEIQHIRLAMNQRKDEASAADNWFKELNVLLNDASETVELCTRRWKLNSPHQTRKKIANFTKDIEKHLTLSTLVHIFQFQELAQKILEGQTQIIKALASSSSSANYTSQAAHAPVGTINSNKEDKPVTFQYEEVHFHEDKPVTFQYEEVHFHLSRDGPPSYESIKVFESHMTGCVAQGFVSHDVEEEEGWIGKVSHDFIAACADELNLTAGEEVQILYEEGEWFYVMKKQAGRDSKMRGLVPQLFIMSS